MPWKTELWVFARADRCVRLGGMFALLGWVAVYRCKEVEDSMNNVIVTNSEKEGMRLMGIMKSSLPVVDG